LNIVFFETVLDFSTASSILSTYLVYLWTCSWCIIWI